MRWLWTKLLWRWEHHLPDPTLGNMAGMMVAACLLAAVLYGAAWGIPPWVGARAGFHGDGWRCTHPGEGEPVCVKDVPTQKPD